LLGFVNSIAKCTKYRPLEKPTTAQLDKNYPTHKTRKIILRLTTASYIANLNPNKSISHPHIVLYGPFIYA